MPSISQELATAAFRFGHTLIRNSFPRMSSEYGKYAAPVELEKNFNNASSVYDEAGGHVESILMGLLGAAGQVNISRTLKLVAGIKAWTTIVTLPTPYGTISSKSLVDR